MHQSICVSENLLDIPLVYNIFVQYELRTSASWRNESKKLGLMRLAEFFLSSFGGKGDTRRPDSKRVSPTKVFSELIRNPLCVLGNTICDIRFFHFAFRFHCNFFHTFALFHFYVFAFDCFRFHILCWRDMSLRNSRLRESNGDCLTAPFHFRAIPARFEGSLFEFTHDLFHFLCFSCAFVCHVFGII